MPFESRGKKELYGPFVWMGFNCLKATATSRKQFTFYHSVPRNSGYSLYRPQKDEKLSRPCSYQVVLNMGPLDWESCALITRYQRQDEVPVWMKYRFIYLICSHWRMNYVYGSDWNAISLILFSMPITYYFNCSVIRPTTSVIRPT